MLGGSLKIMKLHLTLTWRMYPLKRKNLPHPKIVVVSRSKTVLDS